MAGDDEGFLARWSRRKREAETTATEPGELTAAPEASDQPPPAESPDLADILARLPPIEEITATTDIRAFLAPGVPSELRLAALRRAWKTDPAIRDFIGLAENQWDFNAPDGVPGFGSLIDPDEVRRLLAKVVGRDTEPERPGPEAAASDPARTEIAAAPDVTTPASEDQPAPAPIPEAASESEPDETTARERRHGGALPR
ncbi:MAG: DUF3306 domain-containing protein [Xanthobacteraceae bacterium]|jgi:Protein of unknown function (DUF3306)